MNTMNTSFCHSYFMTYFYAPIATTPQKRGPTM